MSSNIGTVVLLKIHAVVGKEHNLSFIAASLLDLPQNAIERLECY